MEIENNLTVVCASHGGLEKIPCLIKSIGDGSVRPVEVIICGTSDSDLDGLSKKDIERCNVKFVKSDVANQVVQRRKALLNVKTEYVLQLDDDLVLERDTIKHYLSYFLEGKSKNKVVCGYTIFPDGCHMSSRTKEQYLSNIMVRWFVYLINGLHVPKNMTLLKSGRIFPYVLEVEINPKPTWLSSCLMYHKKVAKEFILFSDDNKLSYDKKAYYEDVIFTHHLHLKGYKLLLAKEAVLIHPFTKELGIRDFFRTIPFQRELVHRSNGSMFLFAVDITVSTLYYLIRSLKKGNTHA